MAAKLATATNKTNGHINWLEELADEYPTTDRNGKPLRSDAAIRRLAAVFAEEDPAVMLEAAYAYISGGRFFPRVAELRPYVERAREQRRGDMRYDELGNGTLEALRAAHERKMAAIRAGFARYPTCPACGEKTPSLKVCPFCEDIARIQAEPGYEPAAGST
jgi:hypothetical protein